MTPHRIVRIAHNRDKILEKVTGPLNYSFKVKCTLLAKMADE